MKIRTEVIAIVASIRLILAATIGLLEGFGVVHWSPVQIGLIISWFAALNIAMDSASRAAVTPNVRVALTVDQAKALDKPDIYPPPPVV